MNLRKKNPLWDNRKLYLAEDDEKRRGLDAVMRQATQQAQWEYSEEMLKTVAVFRMDVKKFFCKEKESFFAHKNPACYCR